MQDSCSKLLQGYAFRAKRDHFLHGALSVTRPALRAEGAMVLGMPVARGKYRHIPRCENFQITVEHRHHLIATHHRQAAAGQEIILYVRNQ